MTFAPIATFPLDRSLRAAITAAITRQHHGSLAGWLADISAGDWAGLRERNRAQNVQRTHGRLVSEFGRHLMAMGDIGHDCQHGYLVRVAGVQGCGFWANWTEGQRDG